MASNNLQESNYFATLPQDVRFTRTEYRKFYPRSFIGQSVSFELDSLCGPYCYQLSDAMMEVSLKITKSDGSTLPEPNAKVGPVNNVLGSLFEKMGMTINGRRVTSIDYCYPYRCYLNNLLISSGEIQKTRNECAGYCEDEPVEATNDNKGWEKRQSWFRQGYAPGARFRPEGATFIGPFIHDLTNIKRPLPPGKCIGLFQIQSTQQIALLQHSTNDS